MKTKPIAALAFFAIVSLFGMAGCSSFERTLLFHPTHHSQHNGLTPWEEKGEIIGYSRIVASPRNIWLMLHGNSGQASDRLYAIPSFSPEDSVYILEYPGYGNRKGVPSRESFNLAAKEAYTSLRKDYDHIPVCVAGESIGTGPASYLGSLDRPPDKVVLIVPFDRLSLVAEHYFPVFIVRLLLMTDWDNSEALSHYKGPVEIFGADSDSIIPVEHAKALAAAVPGSRLTVIDGEHNGWHSGNRVKIRNP